MAELSKILIEKEGVETEYNFKDTTARANVESAKTEIAQTYIKQLSASGQTITVTKGDNTQSTITTQDTRYTAATQEADGLMAADDKRKLDNIEEGSQKNTVTGVKGSAETNLRTGNIIISPSDLGLGNVENKSSEEIRDELTSENVTEALGYTPPRTDTTYGSMTGATASEAGKTGLVPAPATGKQAQFLRGDATWATPTNTTYSDMTGATASAAGTHGLVPAPASGKQTAYLRGDGTWNVPTNTDTHWTTHLYAGSGAAANAATTNGNTKISVADNTVVRDSVTIKGTGATAVTSDASGVITVNSTNTTYSNMGAASASAAGSAGLVPAPAKGAQGSYLRGDGTWNVPTNTTYSAGTGITLSGTTFSLASGVATAGTVGPSENVTGNEGSTITVPQVTVDTYGRVTALTGRTYTSKNTTYSNMGAATASAAGSAGLVPAPAAGKQTSFLRGDGTWVVPTNTTYGVVSKTANGLAPQLPNETTTTKYLRQDGTWQIPPDTNTTYSTMGAASASAAGTSGLVPAPAKGAQASYLRGDGTWAVPTNTTYSAGSNITLSGTTFSLTKANVTGALGYTPPTTNTTYGVVSKTANGLAPQLPNETTTTKYLRQDGTWVVPPNTTYGTMGAATSSAAGTSGLVPAPAKGAQASFLRGDATWHAIPTGVKGDSESSYRTGSVNITKANIGLGNVENKSSATIRGELTASNVTTALGTTAVSRATADASGNTITSTYAPKASPALTGTPTAPTAAAGTNNTQIATTAFVQTAANARQKAITVSDSAPSSSSGSNGDIWIEY